MDDVVQAMNSLLEAERAGVEALVDLTRMSGDIMEREMLQRIGGEEAWACASLREQIEALGGTPTRRIGPLLTQIRARDHFAARLRLLAQHQQTMLESVQALQEGQPLPDDLRVLLAEVYRVHVSTIAWCEQRAASFGVRDDDQDADVLGRAAEGRPPHEGREIAQRNRNRRQAGYGSKRGEAARADPPLSPH
jgi:hypothetical protein